MASHNTAGAGPVKSRNGLLGLNKATGQWVKSIKGKVRTFGAASLDPTGDKAEGVYVRERDAWESGRNPREEAAATAAAQAAGNQRKPLWELVDRWLAVRKAMVTTADANERISRIAYGGSKIAGEHLLRLMGKDSDPLTWTPDQWRDLRSKLGAGVSPNTKGQRIMYVRSLMDWATRNGHLANAPRWGDDFEGVTRAEKDKHRYEFQQANGERLFTIDDARTILAYADAGVNIQPGNWGSNAEMRLVVGARLLRACCYLAANTGAYSKDISCLESAQVDLGEAYLETLRTKTGALWQATLWPRTVEAIRQYLEVRPKPVKPEWEPLLFITSDGCAISKETVKADGTSSRNDALGQA